MPTSTHGKICYLEMPALDAAQSAEFYLRAFGWKSRLRGDGALAFDDTTGQVSGTWITGRRPAASAGVLIYIMVDDIDDAVRAVRNAGGEIVQAPGVDAPELTARFRDPAGNIFGLYQEPVPPKAA